MGRKSLIGCLVAFCASFLLAWGDVADVCSANTLDVEFSSSSGWVSYTDPSAVGGRALRSGEFEGEYSNQTLDISVTGTGMLTFQWKYVGSVSVSFNQLEPWSYFQENWPSSYDVWSEQEIFVSGGDGRHDVRVYFYGYDSASGMWIRNVTWTPAPSSIPVTYVLNGGSGPGTGSMKPGDRYSDLEEPTRSGYAFAGWFLDSGLTKPADRDKYLPFSDEVVVYAKWVVPVSAMDTDDISFSSEDYGYGIWEVVENKGPNGMASFRSPTAVYRNGESSGLAITVSGSGILTLQWKMVARTGCRVSSPSFNVDGEYVDPSSWQTGKWQVQEFMITGGDDHEVVISYYLDSQVTETALYVADVVWTPAPASMTIRFDANGGSVVDSTRVYNPGDTYGDQGSLPRPTRPGWIFRGWAENDVLGTVVSDEQLVAFHDVALVAKWSKAITALQTSRLTTAKTGGNSTWYALDVDGESIAEMALDSSGAGAYKSVSGWWQMSCASAGYLSFDWMIQLGGRPGIANNGWADLTLYLDGKKVGCHEAWNGKSKGWDTQYLYVPSGKHTLKWVAEGRCSFSWNDDTYGPAPLVRVANLSFVPASAQTSLAAWSGKLKRYDSWRTGDLSRFAAAYNARILADRTDYEARILHAVSILGALAENAEFQKYAKTFGFTVDYARFMLTGTRKFNTKTTAVNTLADRGLALSTPVIKRALDDLGGIPLDWSGSVELSASEWPLDESVHIDVADVMYARASLKATLALLNYLAAYDLTVDWTKAGKAAELTTPIPAVKVVPLIGDAAGWKKNGLVYRGNAQASNSDTNGGVENVWAVRKGGMIALHLENSFAWDEEVQVRQIYFTLESGLEHLDVELSVDDGASDYWEHQNYTTKTNIECWVWNRTVEKKVPATVAIRGSVLQMSMDCTSIRGFSTKSWTMGEGDIHSGAWERDEWGDCRFVRMARGGWSRTNFGKIAQKMRADQTAFFSKVRNAARLDASRELARDALELALAADSAVRSRSADEAMHFIEYEAEMLEKIAFARDNTRRALDALKSVQTYDFGEIVSDYEKAYGVTNAFDCTLLPDNGLMRVYLGALFEGRISRDLLPETRVNEYGELVPNFDTIGDPTFRGLFPDLTISHVDNIVERYYSGDVDTSEWVSDATLEVPGTKVTRTYSDYVGYTASGLPKGWTWNKTTGTLTGTASATFTITLSKVGQPSVKIRMGVASKPALLTFAGNPDSVIVKGTGRYAANAKVSVIAAVKSGYAFVGWYNRETDDLVASGASATIVMPASDLALEARTIPLSEDYLELYPEANDIEVPIGVPITETFGQCFTYGSGSAIGVSAKGLPPGVVLKWDAENGCYGLMGIPVKAGLYTATITAKNAGGFTGSCVIRFWVGRKRPAEQTYAGIYLEGFYRDSLATGRRVSDYALEVPESISGSAVADVKVKNLPIGLKAVYSNGELTISGTPTKAGLYNLEVVVTYVNRVTAKSTQAVFVFDSGSRYLQTSVVRNDPAGTSRGTVSGGGVKKVGSTVKLAAKSASAKKYFFSGWFTDDEAMSPCTDEEALEHVNSHAAALSFVMPEEGLPCLYGRFSTKAEDPVSIATDASQWRVKDEDTGTTVKFPVTVTSGSVSTLSAKGLPAGTKLSGTTLVVSKTSSLVPGDYEVTLTAKNLSGNTATKKIQVKVPNITTAVEMGVLELDTSDEGYSSDDFEVLNAGVAQSFLLADLGIKVQEGWSLAVSGLPSGWTYRNGRISGTATKAGASTLVFTVQKGKTSYRATATFNLASLPNWVAGTFVGATLTTHSSGDEEPGTITATVSSVGKITGSYTVMGDKTSFTGSGFTSYATEGTGMAYRAKVSGKVDGKTKTFTLDITPGSMTTLSNGVVTVGTASFSGNISTRESIQSVCMNQNGYLSPVYRGYMPSITSGTSCSFDWYGTGYNYDTGTMTIKAGSNGVFSCSFKTPRGTVTGSAQLVNLRYDALADSWLGTLAIGVSPDAKKRIPGCYCIVELWMSIDAETGTISSIEPMDVRSYNSFGL